MELCGTYSHPNGHVNCVRFSRDGTVMATACDDKVIRIWSTETLCLIRYLVGHQGEVRALDFSSDSSLIASCAWDRSVRVWEPEHSDESGVKPSSIHNQPCMRVCFKVTSSDWHLIFRHKVWEIILDIDLDHVISVEALRTFKGHTSHVYCLDVCSQRNLIASGGEDKKVYIWKNISPPHSQQQQQDNDRKLNRKMTGGNAIVVGGVGNIISIWSLSEGRVVMNTNLPKDVFQISSIALTEDGEYMGAADWGSRLAVRDRCNRDYKLLTHDSA
eukprot:jgi/Bigna1/130023/aug1.10_g4731